MGSSELGRSTGAPVIRALAGFGIRSSCRATVRGVATHRGSGSVGVQADRGTEPSTLIGSGNTKPPRSAASGIERNRKFVDSLLEEPVSSEPVSEPGCHRRRPGNRAANARRGWGSYKNLGSGDQNPARLCERLQARRKQHRLTWPQPKRHGAFC